jgi:hypothetical protein
MSKLNIFLLCVAVTSIGGVSGKAYAFGPCQARMPVNMSYMPSMQVCNGKAAMVVSGKFYNAFSIVLRDCQMGTVTPAIVKRGPAALMPVALLRCKKL